MPRLKLAKKRISNMSTPQSTASATDGVSPRSRTTCLSHRPKPQRSLSRNRTDSSLNWPMAQRMASRQHRQVTPTTGTA